jgi:hypothetical protein
MKTQRRRTLNLQVFQSAKPGPEPAASFLVDLTDWHHEAYIGCKGQLQHGIKTQFMSNYETTVSESDSRCNVEGVQCAGITGGKQKTTGGGGWILVVMVNRFSGGG